MLKNVKVGDWLAIPHANASPKNVPRIDHDFHAVERLTKTQAVCGDNVRFRLSDGKRVGGDSYFERAVIATPEMIKNRADQAREKFRYWSAKKRVQRLEDHAGVEIRKLRTEQIEALAAAWEEILAM